MRLIDADELTKLFPDYGEGSWTYNRTARMYIDNAPTVELQMGRMTNGIIIPIERPTGEWIPIKDKKGKEIACECSVCNKNPKYDVHSDYCPNCGARMKGEENND